MRKLGTQTLFDIEFECCLNELREMSKYINNSKNVYEKRPSTSHSKEAKRG